MATPKGPADDHLPTRFVRRLVTELLQEPRVEAFWLEGGDDAIQWPPYARLDLHFSVPEPHLQAVRTELLAMLCRAAPVTDFSQQEAPLQGYAGTARLADGTPLAYRIERTSQVGKVPRRAVNLLLDRTHGLLRGALSFEQR
jgi:hypothetical protein